MPLFQVCVLIVSLCAPILDYGDPSKPILNDPNGVRVLTTGGFQLEWSRKKYGSEFKSAFFSGKVPTVTRLDVRHSSDIIIDEQYGEDIWDPTVEQDLKGNEYLYAGVMIPQNGEKNAFWPDNNWSRRTFLFRKSHGYWIRDRLPLFAKIPAEPSWVDHNYGHDFISDAKGRTYIFYERVTEERHGKPWKTELFARRMIRPDKVDQNKEIPIFRFTKKHWPSARRSFGGWLAEGARPFKVGDWFLISFSAGDYMSANYGIHLLYSRNIEGPYLPYLNSEKTDLKDFGKEFERDFSLTWGAARAVFFSDQGQWWAMFHGVPPDQTNKDPDKMFRQLYLAKVEIRNQRQAPPKIRILYTKP